MRTLARTPLQLALRPSARLRASLLLLVAAAAVAVWLSALPRGGLLAIPPLAWMAWRGVARCAGQTLALRADGSACLIAADGGERAVEPQAFAERGPLGVLVLAENGRLWRWPFAGDVLPAALRRELRLWMRDHAQPRQAAAAVLPPHRTTKPG